ncbi:MAG: flagellar basal body P-ring formation protein FlgA [Gammaproteobacteria bacterium]|nr:flagellar basal body P-ring formation protein FlgA [Gammaproteobacteria bacterium]
MKLRDLLSAGLIAIAGMPAGAEISMSELSVRAADVLNDAAQRSYEHARVEVAMQPLDSRLRFPDCDDLSIDVQGSPIGRASALARCTSPQPWSANLPARIIVSHPVVVLARATARGSVLSSGDLAMEDRDLSDLRGQYFVDAAAVVGSELRRDLAPGSALAPRHLKTPLAVQRGDQVAITSSHGKVVVHATGIAMGRGAPGEQISVRNSQSERVIKAWIVGPGRVSTDPPGSPPV